MENSRNRTKDIISIIVVVISIAITIVSCREIAIKQVDPNDVIAVGQTLGIVTLLPTALAIFLAFMYKNVLLSLATGMFLGGLMYTGVHGANMLGFFTASCNEVVETISDRDNANILVLCLAVGGMIEVIRSTGGFESLAKRITKKVDTPRKANLIAQLLGILVFFDDYANALIVGPIMQPITDKLKVSREKLAYIVDSTAAPVTGIALISSWVAVEVAVIEEGLANASVNMSGYALFLQAIPYCFYCIFCLLFIFISSITKKEFGPMLKAESDARKGKVKKDSDNATITQSKEVADISRFQNEGGEKRASCYTAVLPLVILFIYAVFQFFHMGRINAIASGEIIGNEPFSMHLLSTIFGAADTIYIVFEATILGTFVAVIMGYIEKVFTVRDAIASFTKGCSQLLETDLILVLAWTMSSFVKKIGAVHYTVNVISSNVAWWLIPILIFVVCCIVSFAVGSYGCMFIALPMAIPIAIRMMELNPMIIESYLPLVIACGLAGCIFGDHCSPITDCTILSSEGSGCNNFDHVETQLPYAFVTAIVSVVVGIIPTTFGVPAWVSLILGGITFYIILKIFGKVPEAKS